jgi:hypothetical protein
VIKEKFAKGVQRCSTKLNIFVTDILNKITMATKNKAQRFVLLSPDGIPIHPTNAYTTRTQVEKDFVKWKKKFKTQGYYSSNGGRIHLDDLQESCTLVEEKDRHKVVTEYRLAMAPQQWDSLANG